MKRAYAGMGIVLTVVSFNTMADEKPSYFAAEDLADDCVSHNSERTNECFGVIYGVLGTLMYLKSSHSPFADVLCLPPISAVNVKDAFLAAFYANRRGISGMLAGAAVASVLYNRYPCATEKERRDQEAKKAGDKLMQEMLKNEQASK
jgi:hypothetical protein